MCNTKYGVPVETRIIPASEMAAFAADLMQQMKIMAPVRRDGVCWFEWLESAEQLDLSCIIPRSTAKQALLPRSEVLFHYSTGKGREEIVPPPAPEKQALLGLHPCDVRAIGVLDAVFSAEPAPDQPYLARRAATTIIGRGSLADVPTAFFLDMGIDPMDNSGCDLFLVPLDEERFALEIITDKGRELEQVYCGFRSADAKELDLAAEIRKESAAKVKHDFDHEQLAGKLDKMFDSDLWDAIHEKCVGCGICAFLCPTCHCFDIQEQRQGSEGARVRVWDTCQFELFTRHASGHNPRGSQKERIRQRIMHKFCYGVEKFKIPFCVGCGRCVACCPANNDLRSILEQIREKPCE